jgi:hypothetical protein
MRFPALLFAKLAKARVGRFFRGTTHSEAFIDFVDAAEVLHAGSAHPVSHEKIGSLLASPAPVLWIGGSEPLEHPGIAHLVRAIVQSGRFVFLETCGTLLRRRIHEFQPVPQLFLTVRSDGPSASPNPDARKPSPFELALEGLRAARLSGFFTAVHSPVREDSESSRLQTLAGILSSAEIDGWMITAASADDSASQRAVEARTLISNARWRWLSGHIEGELLSVSKAGMQDTLSNEMQHAESCEESVRLT